MQEPIVGECGRTLGKGARAVAQRDTRFARDVRSGLTAARKSLPCVYFYDARGSSLFDEITRLPEYYLTRAESEIILDNAAEITSSLGGPVRVVELGSGTSSKTIALLQTLLEATGGITYVPIDVCGDVLEKSAANIRAAVPGIAVRPVRARYREGLEKLDGDGDILLLWLGSSIGNLDRDDAVAFLRDMRVHLSRGDRMLIGFDLAKDPIVVEAAYNDSSGVTAEFNLNLLRRINRELGADFDPDAFRHVALWNADEGRIEMYIESRIDQTVSIEALGTTVGFASGERIHTENSYKYTLEEIAALAKRSGLGVERQWSDSEGYFSLQSLLVEGR